jgi:plastocyanin
MPAMARLRFAPFVLVLAIVFAACGGSDDDGGSASNDTQAPAGAAGASVTLEDLKFKPDTVSIKVGGTVRWKWEENVLHNVHGGPFESPNKSDGVFTHTFDKAGTYEYECTLHSGMTGTVEVE